MTAFNAVEINVRKFAAAFALAALVVILLGAIPTAIAVAATDTTWDDARRFWFGRQEAKPARVPTQGLPAEYVAAFDGAGVDSSALLGEFCKSATPSGDTLTLVCQNAKSKAYRRAQNDRPESRRPHPLVSHP